jgi:hypothetical protein
MTRFAVLAPCLLLVACGNMTQPPGEMKLYRHAIELGKAEKLKAEIVFPAGEFELRGGAAKLLEGDYRASDDALHPAFEYRESGGEGTLHVDAKGRQAGAAKARWETRLNDSVPVDLHLQMGAGKADIHLGTLQLARLRTEFGAGDITIDLRGRPKKSYSVEIRGGVGQGKIYMPIGVGVRADVEGGIGKIDVQGDLKKNGDAYYNSLWDKAEVRVDLKVRAGIGKIDLIAAE